MSSIASDPQTTTTAPPREASRAPAKFAAPKASFIRRINLRMALIAGIVLLLVGAPFSIWLRQVLSGGIINHGDYYEVNLKAMSDFYLDQVNGQVSDIPAKFRALEGKKVELIGEMWDPHGASDDKLSYFQLVYSNQMLLQRPAAGSALRRRQRRSGKHLLLLFRRHGGRLGHDPHQIPPRSWRCDQERLRGRRG